MAQKKEAKRRPRGKKSEWLSKKTHLKVMRTRSHAQTMPP